MIKKLIYPILILSLTACSTGPRITTLIGFPLIPETTHLQGDRQTVYVGDAMTSSAPLVVVGVATLRTGLSADTSHKGKPMAMVAATGDYALVRQSAEGKFYEATQARLFTLNGQPKSGGLFVPHETTRKHALYWSPNWSREMPLGSRLAMHIAEYDGAPDMTLSISRRPPDNHSDFVSTLTYMGMSGGEIKFVYREYYDGLARAAFTQDVALDYEPGKMYAFKTARFVVHEASTSEVTFTLLQKL